MFIFVGEKPSPRAIKIGATWQNGKLAGATLRKGLLALGIDPDQQHYINLWGSTELFQDEKEHFTVALYALKTYIKPENTIVGMGQRVCKELTRQGITHTAIIHPAARGAIRKSKNYQAHLAERLLG